MTADEIKEQIANLQALLAQMEEAADDEPDKEPSPAAYAKARELNPIDDLFFTKMAESPEVCQNGRMA